MAEGLNESEYRRGLVLGLTLAEVLLLLLFLVLLTLATLYQAIDRDHRAALAKLEESQQELELLKLATGKQVGEPKIAQAIKLYRTLIELVPEAQLDGLVTAVKQAAEIDRSAPPMVLIKGTDLVKAAELKAAELKATEAKATAGGTLPSGSPKSAAGHDESAAGPPQTEKGRAAGEGTAGSSGAPKAGHNWPPIITLSEAGGHFFASGSSVVPSDLQSVLKGDVADKLRGIIAEYKVDVIEVIGHTDEQPILRTPSLDRPASTLDRGLLPSIRGLPAAPAIAADNAGLGLARAAAVVRILRSDQRLSGLEILPLSGGQLIDVGDRLSMNPTGTAAPSRRRIEIRLRRRSNEADPIQTSAIWKTELTPATPPASSGVTSFTGKAHVVDGDTFDLGTTRIRLWGVDAIEGAQACRLNGSTWGCGEEARRRLTAFLGSADVVCEPKDRDKYGRTVAACSSGGRDVGAWLVAEGFALDYPEYSNGFYRDQQVKAQAEKRGIWQSEFEMPWEWRRMNGNH